MTNKSGSKNEGKARGGIARRDALTPDQRTSIAKKAAQARHGFKATHKGNFKDEFGIDVDCYVLNDEAKTAVISQRGLGGALGLSMTSGAALQRFVANDKMAAAAGAELLKKLANPLVFKWVPPVPSDGPPSTVHGYDVTILIDLCKAALAAKLPPDRYEKVIEQAQVVIGASAKAGIKGLVYALAGYDQTREEVIAAFKKYVADEAREYEKEFPPELYQHWYRLYALPQPERGRNWKFVHLTRDHVYTPLAHSNGQILALTKAQKAENGDRNVKLHQLLSDVGVKALRTHLGQLLGVAKIADTQREYERHVGKLFGVQQTLDIT